MSISLVTNPLVNQACYLLNTNKSFKALGVEICSINTPKILLTRTPRERLDVTVAELGNTVGFFSLLWGGGRLVDGLMKPMKMKINPNPEVISQGRTGKSLLMVPLLFGFMYAMAFFRNAFTAWNFDTTNFRKLITDKDGSNAPGAKLSSTFAHHHSKQSVDMTKKELGIAGKVMATAATISVLGFLAAKGVGPWRLFKRGSNELRPSLKAIGVEHLLKKACLGGEHATSLLDRHAILYWGVPCYAGWINASRDAYEVKEQILKTINFMVMYVVPDMVINSLPYFENGSAKFAKKLPEFYKSGAFDYKKWKQATRLSPLKTSLLKQAHRFENRKTVTKFAATTFFMAVFPTLLNIYLTKQRLKRDEAKQMHVSRSYPLQAKVVGPASLHPVQRQYVPATINQQPLSMPSQASWATSQAWPMFPYYLNEGTR